MKATFVSLQKSRGQAAGLYIDRKEIMMGKIDQMSREEVMKEIQKMQEEFPQLVEQTKPAIDVDYTDIEVHPKADEKT